MAPAFKRTVLVFFFGDVLFSLFIFIFIHWLRSEIMFFHKQIYFSGYNLPGAQEFPPRFRKPTPGISLGEIEDDLL